MPAYPNSVNEVSVGFEGNVRVVHMHEFREGEGQLDHLAEVHHIVNVIR